MGYIRGITTDRAQPTVPTARGTAGFKGTSKVDGDAARVLPPRAVVVPAGDLSPLAAQGGGVVSGGGVGVTVEVPPAAPVAVTNIVAPGAAVVGEEATLATVTIFTATRTLSSAELLALSTVPIEIVAGLADKLLQPLGALGFFHAGATPYDGTPSLLFVGPSLAEGATVALLSASTAVLIGVSADTPVYLVDANLGDGALADGVGVGLSLFDDGGGLIDGDGTLDITVIYAAIAVLP